MRKEPFYDMETKNESFLRVQKELEELGVKNNKFFLELKNKKVQGLNPFDQQLKFEDIPLIQMEARKNIWYFFRECVRVRDNIGTSTEAGQFNLTQTKLAMIFLAMNNISQIIQAPRQTEKSTCAMALFKWLNSYQETKQLEVIGLHDVDAEHLCNRAVYSFDIPPYLIPVHVDMAGRVVRSIWYENQERLTEDIAEPKIARLFIDEFYEMKDNKAAFNKWKKAKKRPSLIITGMPQKNPTNDKCLEFAKELATKIAVPFKNEYYDDPDMISKSKKDIFLVSFDPRTNFKSGEEWEAYRKKMQESLPNEEFFKNEVMLEW
jgi:hypothetical protein